MGVPIITLPRAVIGEDTSRSSADGPDVKPLTLADRRFRWVFLRALKRQKAKGEVDAKTYRRLRVAAWSGMPIAGGDGGPKRPFVGHLREAVDKKRKNSGGLFDIFDGSEWSWDGVLEWMLENWQVILRIALSLLMFLDKAESE